MRNKTKKMIQEGFPGTHTQVQLSEHDPHVYPSGRQYADNPNQYPPYHRSPDHTTEKETKPKEVQGWGADLDTRNRPGYPKERFPARYIGVHWDQPEGQVPSIEVFHSVERPGITPIFGTSAPPRGLSGIVRKWAYGRSENDILHWLTLMAADRIDVIEGVLDDLVHGHVPNFYKERGLKAEWKFNRARAVRRMATWGLILGGVGWFLGRRFRRS